MRKLVYILFMSVTFFLTPACHHAGDEHEHEHHHDAVQYTAYGADFELFAEAAPFCVGEASEVTVHLTWLSNFKPLDSTQVKISLIVAGKVFTETLDHPEQPGIYKCHFTPTQAGCGGMKVEVMLPNRVSEVCCHHVHVAGSHAELHEHTHEHAHEHSHEHSHEHGEEHHHGHEHSHEHGDAHDHSHEHSHAHNATNAITFTKEQSWKIDFATDTLRLQPFGSVIKAAGQVLPSQGDECEATATTSGVVVYSNPNLVEGAAVKAGQFSPAVVKGNGAAYLFQVLSKKEREGSKFDAKQQQSKRRRIEKNW